MIHIDLFSGIGGFAYAAHQVWPDYRNLFFCDTNIFCQAVIRKNFGSDSLIYGDIREVTVERVIADTEQFGLLQRKHKKWTRQKEGIFEGGIEYGVDLLTGGFPCQPFSAAGKRKGRDDDRHLWPEMFRVIKAFRPRWVIAENVRGLLSIENGMAFEQVCLDLEAAGYTVQAFVIPACAVNAPHRRDRIWIVAKSTGSGLEGIIQRPGTVGEAKGERFTDNAERSDCHAADAEGQGLEGRNTTGNGCAGGRNTEYTWDTPWLTVAAVTCVRGIHDGLPARVDGLKLSKSKHREERLKALGNAIVPQVVMEIMKSIKCTGGIM